MAETKFRLILKRLSSQVKKDILIDFLHRELEKDAGAIKEIISIPPRVIVSNLPLQEIQSLRDKMEKLGCQVKIEPVQVYPDHNMIISKRHVKVIRAELNKILRCRSNLLFFIVRVESTGENIIPSMMGPFVSRVASYFRESDTILGVDDRNIIIVAFAVYDDGIESLKKKIGRVISTLLKQEARIYMGVASFPMQCRSFEELLWAAGEDLERSILARTEKRGDHFPEEKTSYGVSSASLGRGEPDSDPGREGRPLHLKERIKKPTFHLCCKHAHGTIFRRLQDLGPDAIWLGLYQMPPSEQERFLARLPLGCNLVSQLYDMIHEKTAPLGNDSVEANFEAILHQMRLEERLNERELVKKEILSMLNRVNSLPTLPSVATRVFELSSSMDSSASDITDVISADQAITSKLLKIVNSAFYGFPQRIATVKQAVVILGTEEIVNIAFGVAASTIFQETGNRGLFDMKQLWRHSIYTAIIGRSLCSDFPMYRRQGIFTACLLHDIGKIFLVDKFHEQYSEVFKITEKNDIPLFESEDELLGLNHATIGRYLASNWNLPEALVQSIGYHHQPFLASSHDKLAAIVGLADYIAHDIQMREEDKPITSLTKTGLTHGHWMILKGIFKGLKQEDIPEMVKNSEGVVRENRQLFEILS